MRARNPYTWATEEATIRHGADALCDAARAEHADRIVKHKQAWDAVKNETAALLRVSVANPGAVYDRCLAWLEDCDESMLMLIEEIEEGAR